MQSILEQIFSTSKGAPGPETLALCLLLAFVLGQLFAWFYKWTHAGLSYSQTFVQAIVMLTIVSTLVMIVIGSNIIAAFGLIGAVAIIRFRNVLKDTRDTVFVFATLVVGMAVGSRQFGLAITGCLALGSIMLYLHWTRFGSKEFHDGMLRFRLVEPAGADVLGPILQRHCRRTELASVRRMDPGSSDYAYEVTLRDRQRNGELLDELGEVKGLESLSLSLSEDLQEI